MMWYCIIFSAVLQELLLYSMILQFEKTKWISVLVNFNAVCFAVFKPPHSLCPPQ